ncbi:ADP-ribose pyrophosphatase YjhB, NUDIX family [Amycolatopsis pretoriensis]|uniref:ADP-ribose pyrophosphatase YjhB, NUDIX family n=1 Tax=Amycolatopsis pretoriensis TaxID=218821 RepID=A0A1H5Q7W2_9PSEU|nr:NUDIX domain-containing protein [Amycolatopsis pretoriensis]SEF22156.1 ADP-ribose pyrophosphatase YjhB, NUDIX family [Amycolatopsis pretoriensis]
MPGSDELVALYDQAGSVVGTTTRSRVRAEALWHAAGVVLVRSGDGRAVYVHLRTAVKDVFPSTWDCWAGGVVAAGESPAGCARRELAEELGVHGVEPVPLFTKVYDDGRNRCHNFAFEVRWDGPIRHQAEEIVEGRWIPLEDLRAWVDDPAPELPFIPDGREGVQEWFRRYG